MSRSVSFLVHICLLLWLCIKPALDLVNPVHAPNRGEKLLRLSLRDLPNKGEGGGGDRSKLPVSFGRHPVIARNVFVPPAPIVNHTPALPVVPAILSDTDVPVTPVNVSEIGDPNGVRGPFSLGSGTNGIGANGNGGIGVHRGPGIEGGGGEAEAQGPITGPEVIYKTEPEFSEQARKAKLQGVVVLEAQIGPDGKAHAIHVRNGLGLGLDEQAIDAVEHWRFRPARRGSKSIVVTAVIEINFRLL